MNDRSVRVTWLGAAGLYVTDGETALLIDPFVSRPGLLRVGLGFSLVCDKEAVSRCLASLFAAEMANDADSPVSCGTVPLRDGGANTASNDRDGAPRVSAILVGHSHYDHVMDVPEFARRTGALVVGSSSTANVLRGAGIAEDRIRIIEDRSQMSYGAFTVTFVQSIHGPALFGRIPYPGEIEAPLSQPACAASYREGGTFAIAIAHPEGRLLHNGSAGVQAGVFSEQQADVVFLGLGGRKDTPTLIDGIVVPLAATTVVPIHHDNMFVSLDGGWRPLPFVNMNEFETAMADYPAVDVRHVGIGEEFRPFSFR